MPSILILGATSDIAQAIAHSFADKKFDIILAGRQMDELQRIEKDITIRFGVYVSSQFFDAANPAHHAEFVKNLQPVPEVVACVFGYLGDQLKAQGNWDECANIIQVNYVGAVSVLSYFANVYESKKTGTIIGISSVAGERGRQSNYIYGSAKAGFSVFLDGLRNRLFASNVHVITVKPGFVNTRMTQGLKLPKPITAEPSQVGKAVYSAYQKKTNTLYVLWMWKWIMLIIKFIPEPIFKKLKL